MSIEQLLREAMSGGVTYISIDRASGTTRIGAWKAPLGRYFSAEAHDSAEALMAALRQVTNQNDLSDLLG